MTLDKWQREAEGGGGWVTWWGGFVLGGGRYRKVKRAHARTHRCTDRNDRTFGAASHIRSHKWFIQVKSERLLLPPLLLLPPPSLLLLLLDQRTDVLQSTVGAGFPSINSRPKENEFNPYLQVPITLQLWHADPKQEINSRTRPNSLTGSFAQGWKSLEFLFRKFGDFFYFSIFFRSY